MVPFDEQSHEGTIRIKSRVRRNPLMRGRSALLADMRGHGTLNTRFTLQNKRSDATPFGSITGVWKITMGSLRDIRRGKSSRHESIGCKNEAGVRQTVATGLIWIVPLRTMLFCTSSLARHKQLDTFPICVRTRGECVAFTRLQLDRTRRSEKLKPTAFVESNEFIGSASTRLVPDYATEDRFSERCFITDFVRNIH